jgi:hypothetical protein
MHDNKVRLSPDVLEKANLIAEAWGLKNTRAAVEAVFRRYADEYLGAPRRAIAETTASWNMPIPSMAADGSFSVRCEALEELDELLGL